MQNTSHYCLRFTLYKIVLTARVEILSKTEISTMVLPTHPGKNGGERE
jgi:hypothetical protein